jgi:hypothetical protein
VRTSKTTMRAAGTFGFAAVLVLGACGSGATRVTTPTGSDRSTVPTTTTAATSAPAGAAIPVAPASAEGKADEMLDAVLVPPGSRPVPSLPGRAFDQPWEEPACFPLVDKSRLWEVAGDPQSVFSYLKAHAPTWIPYNSTGQVSGQFSASTLEGYPTGPGWSSPSSAYQLDLTVAANGHRSTGIRADGEVIPPGATCKSGGGTAASG